MNPNNEAFIGMAAFFLCGIASLWFYSADLERELSDCRSHVERLEQVR
jgi:hypothetical protein